MNRRYELLSSLADENVTDSNFLKSLDQVIQGEKKLLKTIVGDDEDFRHVVKRVTDRLQDYTNKFGRKDIHLFFLTIREGYGGGNGAFDNMLSNKLFRKLMKKLINLLRHMDENMKHIEKRLEVEERFLKNPDRDRFKRFIQAWTEELNLNERTARIYHDIVVSNLNTRRMIETDRSRLKQDTSSIPDDARFSGAENAFLNVGAVQCEIIFGLIEGIGELFGYKGRGEKWLDSTNDLNLIRKLQKKYDGTNKLDRGERFFT